MIVKVKEVSVFDKILSVTWQTECLQVDCSRVVVQQ